MASGRAARRDFRDGGDGVVAVGKFDLLERGAFDAGLLGEGRDSEAGEGENEQSLFEHCFLPGTADPSSAAIPGKVAIGLFSA
jgi:hypothetical protein